MIFGETSRFFLHRNFTMFREIFVIFRENSPDLSARAKRNSRGAPCFAERENPEERKSTPRDPGGRKRWLGSANPYNGYTGYTARLLRTSRKTGRTYTLRERNGEGSEGEQRREKGPEGRPHMYNATATPQPPRGAGGAPEA